MKKPVICVVGLGYVGGPLAEAFSQHFTTIGFDIDKRKIESLKKSNSKILPTDDPTMIKEADYIMICVPTPVTKSKEPDLSPVRSAAEIVGKNLKKGTTVVLESTVYPGVTEEVMKPILERQSSFVCGVDFRIGYSPERINPGDDHHELATITKIVAGMDQETCDDLAGVYGHVTNVYKTQNIQTAEAAKVIENIQRDLNIALMNELSVIFHHLNINTRHVLAAAGTKWNFLPFVPGLVGGHCIPVDPYYLVARSKEFGYHPQVILAGRAINDSMPKYVANLAVKGINHVGKVIKGSNVLVMGLTYKENVPDTRESPVKDMIEELLSYEIKVYGYDPLLSKEIIQHFGAIPVSSPGEIQFDAVIISVAHDQFRKLTPDDLCSYMNTKPVLIDVRGIIDRSAAEKKGIYYSSL